MLLGWRRFRINRQRENLFSGDEPVRWYFRIRTIPGERMPSRVLYVLDVQQIQPLELHLVRLSDAVHMHFVIETDESKAARIGLLLRRLEFAFSVLWTPISENAT